MPYPVVGSLTRTWVTAPTSFPVAVPDKIFGLTLILDFIDRCHSLSSLHPPPAAVASLPVLDNRRAGHADVKQGTKENCRKIANIYLKYTKKEVFIWLNQNP